MVAIGKMGKVYGYCYQPLRFTTPDEPFTGTSDRHEWSGKHGEYPKQMPYFNDREQAVQYLKDHGYYGQVLRYCKDRQGNRSWVTAGVTDIVNVPVGKKPFATICGNSRHIQVHYADGTTDPEMSEALALISKTAWEIMDHDEGRCNDVHVEI